MAFHKIFGNTVKFGFVLAIGANICMAARMGANHEVPADSPALQTAADQLTTTISETDFSSDESIAYMGEMVATINNSLAEEIDGTFEAAMVKRVVDGDTIIVDIDHTGEVSVRMIGINTPESVASEEYLERTGKENTEEGVIASDYTKSLLHEGDIVYLQSDTSDTDRYGRLLRYVWTEIPSDTMDLNEVSEKMVNAILVYEGYAEAVSYAPDTMYADYFKTLEENGEVKDERE